MITSKRIDVTTTSGRRITVVERQHWIDAGTKDGSDRVPGQKELRTESGFAIGFDGDFFHLPNGDTFQHP